MKAEQAAPSLCRDVKMMMMMKSENSITYIVSTSVPGLVNITEIEYENHVTISPTRTHAAFLDMTISR